MICYKTHLWTHWKFSTYNHISLPVIRFHFLFNGLLLIAPLAGMGIMSIPTNEQHWRHCMFTSEDYGPCHGIELMIRFVYWLWNLWVSRTVQFSSPWMPSLSYFICTNCTLRRLFRDSGFRARIRCEYASMRLKLQFRRRWTWFSFWLNFQLTWLLSKPGLRVGHKGRENSLYG